MKPRGRPLARRFMTPNPRRPVSMAPDYSHWPRAWPDLAGAQYVMLRQLRLRYRRGVFIGAMDTLTGYVRVVRIEPATWDRPMRVREWVLLRDGRMRFALPGEPYVDAENQLERVA